MSISLKFGQVWECVNEDYGAEADPSVPNDTLGCCTIRPVATDETRADRGTRLSASRLRAR
jgi:hypothetical protein